MSRQFISFLTTHGIIHRVTCPHTREQNDISERKHMHFMEVGLSFLAQSHLKTYFWIDVFQTTIYLIHQLPSLVLKHVSPYSKLFQNELDYSILRVFGCACYPLLRPYSTHKLSFQSKQCIFLGYNSNHRGYRCLDPISKRIYVSRHVIFDEGLFLAKDTRIAPPSSTVVASV
jgi:hypothetical protein